MTGDLYPTPHRLALLRDVAAGEIWQSSNHESWDALMFKRTARLAEAEGATRRPGGPRRAPGAAVMTRLLLFLPFAVLIVGVWTVVFAFAIGGGRGEASEAPGPTAEGEAVPGCDCEDCEYEREFAGIVEGLKADA